MQRFIIHALKDWAQLTVAQIIQFPQGQRGRTVRFMVNANRRVDVYASEKEDMTGEVLAASAEGIFEVEISTRDDLYLQIRSADPEAVVFLRTRDADHRVEKVSFEKFTTIERRRSRNTELDRMMMLMRHNEMMREQKLQEQIALLRTSAVRPEPEAPPVVQDDPAPEIAPEGDEVPADGGE